MDNFNVPEVKKPKTLFTRHENAVRFLTLFILGVLGYGLSMIGKIPGMTVDGIFPIEPSDAVVLAAYALYGFWASLFVALMKTGLLMLTFFNAIAKPIPIAAIFSFCMALFLAFGILVMDKSLRMFHKNIWSRLVSYLLVSVFVSLSMLSLEYALLVPIAFNNYQWTNIYQVDTAAIMSKYASFFPYPNSYDLSMLRVFLPYNFIRNLSVCLIYEICFHHLIFKVLKGGLFTENFFMNKNDLTEEKLNINLRKKALRSAQLKEMKERQVDLLKKKNAKKVLLDENKGPNFISQHDYQYDMTIDDYGSIHNVSITTDSESSAVFIDYIKNAHPGSKFHISSYREGQTIVRNASTDGLSPELFRSVNGYDEEVTKIIEIALVIRASIRKATTV